jgi:hypothetical protein
VVSVASLQRKIKNGRPYWYVIETARVNGQPRVVRQRYLGTVASIEAAFDAALSPEQVDQVEFGASAVMWTLAARLRIAEAVDAVAPKRRQGLSVGTYLAAATVNRAVQACSKRAFGRWYDRSVLSRLVPAPAEAWTSQRFWDAMDRVDPDRLGEVEQAVITRLVNEFDVAADALAFDTTNFHTFYASTNTRSTLAARGKSKARRHDLRLVGWALAVSADHQLPLASWTYQGNRHATTARSSPRRCPGCSSGWNASESLPSESPSCSTKATTPRSTSAWSTTPVWASSARSCSPSTPACSTSPTSATPRWTASTASPRTGRPTTRSSANRAP